MLVVLCLAVFAVGRATNDVLLMHGLLDNHNTMERIAARIQEDFPGTYTHSIQLFPDVQSLTSLKLQSKKLIKYIKRLQRSGPLTIIGHSQGAVITRHALETWSGHNITTFVSVAGPHLGVCKVPINHEEVEARRFQGISNATLSALCYTDAGQELSVCNLWNDPVRQEAYLSENKFLPSSLCQTNKKGCAEKARNLKRLERMVLIAGPQDGEVYPWQSGLFSYYDEHWSMVERADQDFYKRLGLQYMEKRGQIVECIKGGVEHVEFVFDEVVYEDCIKPYLA